MQCAAPLLQVCRQAVTTRGQGKLAIYAWERSLRGVTWTVDPVIDADSVKIQRTRIVATDNLADSLPITLLLFCSSASFPVLACFEKRQDI